MNLTVISPHTSAGFFKSLLSRYFKYQLLFFLLFGAFFKGNACSPLTNAPAVTYTVTGTTMALSFTSTNTYNGCTNVFDVEFACSTGTFTGIAAATFTTAPFTTSAAPYIVPNLTLNIASLCPGTAYKFRVRERNNNSTPVSPWTTPFTFTTSGTAVAPSLNVTASPAVVCPPATNQLSATVNNSCGGNTITYTWVPAAGLNSANIANPVASVTATTTYTVYASGGQLGCWTASNVITLNLGTSPPVGGTATAAPASICFGKTSTVSVSGYSGNIQWQSASSSSGPWTNIVNATNPSYATPPINGPTCFQVLVTGCSGTNVATSNVVCINANLSPVLTPSPGCTGTIASASFSYTGASGTPTSIVWSPTPLSISSNSTLANFTNFGVASFTVTFPDGCISSNSINVPQPALNFSSSAITCSTLGNATVFPVNMPGGYAYYWDPSAQTASVANNLFPGNYTVTVGFDNNNCLITQTVNFPATPVFNSTVNSTPSLSCFGVNTGTASITISGGTGNYGYSWVSSMVTQNTPTVNNLGAGSYTVTVNDLVTLCTLTNSFTIAQPPAMSITVSAVSPSACAGKSTTLSVAGGGGTPGSGSGYTYSWTAGPTTTNYVVSQALGGIYNYSVTAFDGNNCAIQGNYVVNFVNNPIITVPNTSICPLQVGTLSASGATSYTWNAVTVSNVFTATPLANTLYTLVGSAQGCTSTASASMIIKPIPTPTASSSSPVCNGQPLTLSAQGGVGYAWFGPLNFTATGQSAVLNPALSGHNGVFTVVATAVNSCTGSATTSVTIIANPTITVVGSTVCSTQAINLTANSVAGATYSWTGPGGFSSGLQNPSIASPQVINSGTYTAFVTSPQGCTNVAYANVTVTAMPVLTPTNSGPVCVGNPFYLGVNPINGGFYSWNGPNSFLSGLQTPSLSPAILASGGVYVVFVTLGPCQATGGTSLTVNALPTPTIISNSPVCETKSLSLGVACPNIQSYVWSGPMGYNSSQANSGRDSCTLLNSGIYTITVTDIHSCTSFTTASVTIESNPVITAVGATVCIHDEAQLKASGGVSYVWTNASGFVSNQTNAIIASASSTAPTVYTVVGTALNTCSAVTTVTLATLPLPVANIDVWPSNSQCVNKPFILTSSGAFGYDWSGPNQFAYSAPSATVMPTNQSYSGTYSLVVKDIHGCRSMTTTVLKVNNLPGGGLGGVFKGCVPFCSDYVYYPSGLSAKVVNREWNLPGLSFLKDTFNICFKYPGDYLVKGTITDANSCVNTLTYMVNVYPKPVADFTFTPEKPVETMDEVTLINTSDPLTNNKWSWFIGDNEEFGKNSVRTSRTFDDSGIYPVAMVIKNQYGCLDSIMRVITVAEDFNIYVPDVFSPNGDGVNDIFIPVTRGVKSYTFKVFNRWGSKIFETTDRTVGWDGITGGKASQTDVYIWSVSASSNKGEIKELKGHVTLYR